MFKGADCKRLATKAMRAADAGDIDAAIAFADSVSAIVSDDRRLARWVAVAGGAVGTAVQTAPEASGDQLSRALGHLESALHVLPHVDTDFAVSFRIHLLASRIAICAMTGDQRQLSEDLESLERAWDRLTSDPTYSLALSVVRRAMTVMLGLLATVGWGLLVQLRLSEARQVLLLTAKWASEEHDDKVELTSAVLLANIFMLAGDQGVARSFAQAALDVRDRSAKFRTPLPLATLGLLEAMLARVCAWDCMRDGEALQAREVLMTTRIRLTPGDKSELLPAYLFVLSHELQLLLDLGEVAQAAVVADATDARSLFAGHAGGIVAGPLIRLIETDDRALAATIVKRLAVQYEWRVPPSLFVQHLGAMALLCAENMDEELAIACVQRAVECLTLLGSNRWLASGRAAALAEHRGLRDQCLAALSAVRDHPAASSLGQEVMEAWREGSLRDLALNPVVGLSDHARQLVVDLNAVLLATGAGDQEIDPSARERVAEQISAMRENLKREVGVGYASLLAPRSLELSPFEGTQGRIIVSACLTRDSTRASIVSVTAIPGRAAQLRMTMVSDAIVEFLRVIGEGFDPVVLSRVRQFEELWQSARTGLSYALGVDLIEDIGTVDLPVQFLLDEELRSLPVAALGTSPSQLGIGRTVSNVTSARPSATEGLESRSARPSVLAFAYESALLEVPVLRSLEARGAVALEVVSTLAALRAALEVRSFDVLVISAHGHGTGMEYRFRADAHDVLYVHDLFGVPIPPIVLAASCFSGVGGESDISGLLATLHAQGAREVLSSLWAIPAKESSSIVSYVLEGISGGESLATSLRAAQVRFEEDHSERDGIYWWAGLTVTSI